jgi:hypothetical protein
MHRIHILLVTGAIATAGCGAAAAHGAGRASNPSDDRSGDYLSITGAVDDRIDITGNETVRVAYCQTVEEQGTPLMVVRISGRSRGGNQLVTTFDAVGQGSQFRAKASQSLAANYATIMVSDENGQPKGLFEAVDVRLTTNSARNRGTITGELAGRTGRIHVDSRWTCEGTAAL